MAQHFVIVQGGVVVQVFGGPQNPVGLPGYQVLPDDSDPLWFAWLAAQAAKSATNTTNIRYATALAAGVIVSSIGTPALDGTYGTTTADQINFNASMSLFGIGAFPGFFYAGASKITMTGAQFETIFSVTMAYLAALNDAYQQTLAGGAPAWPSNVLTVP
jgi:hypothetical protein